MKGEKLPSEESDQCHLGEKEMGGERTWGEQGYISECLKGTEKSAGQWWRPQACGLPSCL